LHHSDAEAIHGTLWCICDFRERRLMRLAVAISVAVPVTISAVHMAIARCPAV
jgi:hypothetical protein